MIQLQFRDIAGVETKVVFDGETGIVNVWCHGYVTTYSKDSPIAGMYQRMLHNSREVSPSIFQVIGAW